jgi:hypothetical protein
VSTRRLYSYLVTNDGRFFSCFGKDREKIVAEELADGGRHILTQEFSPDATQREIEMFGDGVREGYKTARQNMQSVLGIYT